MKVACTVLRGLGGSNAPWLPDHLTRLSWSVVKVVGSAAEARHGGSSPQPLRR